MGQIKHWPTLSRLGLLRSTKLCSNRFKCQIIDLEGIIMSELEPHQA